MLLVDESVITPKDIIQNTTPTLNNMERKKNKTTNSIKTDPSL